MFENFNRLNLLKGNSMFINWMKIQFLSNIHMN
jgi:hypothetical protein